MPYFEFVEGSSKKFWSIERSATKIITRYGRIGSQGQTSEKEYETDAEARTAYDSLVQEKTKKGYVLVESAATAALMPAARGSAREDDYVPPSPPPSTKVRVPSLDSYGVPLNALDANGLRRGIWLEIDAYATVESRWDQGRLDGLRRTFDPEGRLIGEEHYRARPDEPKDVGLHYGATQIGKQIFYHSNGAARFEGEYLESGVIHGAQREFSPTGELLSEIVYDSGRRHGVCRKRQEDGKLSAQPWEHGRPVLKEKQEAQLIAKLPKVNADKRKELLEALTDGESCGPLLWHLIESGKYPTHDAPRLWPILVDTKKSASSEQILFFFQSIQSTDSIAWADLLAMSLEDSPYSWRQLDKMLEEIYFTVPAARWERLVGEVAPPLRLGLQQLRARMGASIPEEDRKTILGFLADSQVGSWYLIDNFRLHADGSESELTEDIGNSSALRQRYFRLFGSDEEWASALLTRALDIAEKVAGTPLSLEQVRPAVNLANREQLMKLAESLSLWQIGHVSMFDQRHDSLEDLVWLGDQWLDNTWPSGIKSPLKTLAEACFIAAARRCHSYGEILPEAFDHFISFTTYEAPPSSPAKGMTELQDALATVPKGRLASVIRRIFNDPESDKARVAFAIPLTDDPALLDELIAHLAAEANKGHQEGYYWHRVVLGAFLAGKVGAWGIAAFEKAHECAANDDERDIFHRTIVSALSVMAKSGEPIPERLDRFVDYWQARDEHDVTNFWEPLNRAVLEAISPQRAEVILLRSLDGKGMQWTAPFAAFAVCYTDAVARQFSEVIAAAVPKIGPGSLEGALKALGQRAYPALSDALRKSNMHPDLLGALQNALGSAYQEVVNAAGGGGEARKERREEAIARLTRDLPGERVSIYLLDSDDREDAGENDISRALGRPIGVTDETWPVYHEMPMEHVLTLDLDELPELKSQNELEGYRALAVFVPDSESGEDLWDSKVMLLTEEQVAMGAYRGENVKDEENAWRIRIARVEVPRAVFAEDDEENGESNERPDLDEEQRAKLEQVDKAVHGAPGRVLGPPHWIRSAYDGEEGFLFQFSEALSPINLGWGIMYVYKDKCEWQL